MMFPKMSRIHWFSLPSLLLVGLMGCKPQTVVMSDDELRDFKSKPQSQGVVGSDSTTRPSDGANPAPESPGMGRTPDKMGLAGPAGRPSQGGGAGLSANPSPEASTGRPNRLQNAGGRPSGSGDMGGFRRRQEPQRSESADISIAGAKISVIGVFKISDGKVTAWKADGSPNPALKTEMDAALGKIPEGARSMMTNMGGGSMIFVLSRVDGAKRPGMVSGEFGSRRMFGGLMASKDYNRILSVANIEEGSSTVSVRYRVEEIQPMTVSIPFKEGTSAKMGNGSITLQAINDGGAPESDERERPRGGGDREGMTPTGHLVFLKTSLPDAPFSMELIGKDGKPFTLVDKDGKPTVMPRPEGGPGRRPNMEGFRSIHPAYRIVDNDAASVVANLMIKRDLIASVKITLAPQTIVERKGIAAKPK